MFSLILEGVDPFALLDDVHADVGEAIVTSLKRSGIYARVAGYLCEARLMRVDSNVVDAVGFTQGPEHPDDPLRLTLAERDRLVAIVTPWCSGPLQSGPRVSHIKRESNGVAAEA